MDNVTHTLVGVALARAGFNRVTPGAMWLLILSSNLPDIDIVTLAGGQLAYFENHRGYTHTFVALPLLALITAAVVCLFTRSWKSLPQACAVACVGLAGHLALDWTNSYGVRPLLPFSSRWFYLDLNGLYDIVILAVLIGILIVPWFASLVAGEMGRTRPYRGQKSAVLGLLLILAFDAMRWNLHRRVLKALQARSYEEERPIRVAALPGSYNPFEWTGIVETSQAFFKLKRSALFSGDDLDMQVFSKAPAGNSASRAAASTEPFAYLAYFSRFPVWTLEPLEAGATGASKVELSDLRFGVPGAGSFHSIAVVDAAGRIVSTQFRF